MPMDRDVPPPHRDRSDPGWQRIWAAISPGLTPHPIEPGTLGEYALVLRERGPSEAARAFPDVAAHLAGGCDQCASDLRDFPAPGVGLVAGTPVWSDVVEGLRRVAAILLPRQGLTLAAAQRGLGPGGIRTYQAGPVSLSMAVVGPTAAGELMLEGLVAGPYDVAGGSARLSTPDGTERIAGVDALGGFSFGGLSRGRYLLEVALGTEVVVVEDLTVEV
jgi:hypothetical protein